MEKILKKWKIWLRRIIFSLSAAGDEYSASVSTAGQKTARNSDIAKIIVERRTELRYETVMYVLDLYDEIIREMLQQGLSVLTGCCQFTPRVQGMWKGINAKYNPAIHKIGLHIIPSAEMRAALKDIELEVLGVKNDGAFIGMVTDTTTGLADGTMTSGDDIMIEGDKIKVGPDNEAGLGVFLVNSDGNVIPVTRRLTQNDPKKLIARVPDLPAGQYILRIKTRFTHGNTTLKEPRIIDYDRPLVIN